MSLYIGAMRAVSWVPRIIYGVGTVNTIENPNADTGSKADLFGWSVDSCDSYTIVGAPGEVLSGYGTVGAAYVFDNSDGSVLYTLRLTGPAIFDYFGDVAAISETHAIVGAYGSGTGKVEIFDMSDGSSLHVLTLPAGLTGPFPYRVGLSPTYAFASSLNSSTGGAVSLFNLSDGLLYRTYTNPNNYGTVTDDFFGVYAVAMTDAYTLVGAPGEDDATYTDTGVAYLFDNTDGSTIYTLTNPNDFSTAHYDEFGAYVALSDRYMFISATHENNAGGVVYVFSIEDGSLIHTIQDPNAYGTVTSDEFGSFLGVSPNGFLLLVGAWREDDAGGINSGKAYLFDTRTWGLLATIDNPNAYDTSANDTFSWGGVGIGNTTISICAKGEDDATTSLSGRLYLFPITEA